MLLKNGKIISECWWEPYAPQYRHQLFSMSKSFTSAAIGIAVNEGLLTLNTLVADIFAKEIEELGSHADEKIRKITVKNLLTMSTGMEYEKWASWNLNENNIKNFLSLHIKNEPGSVFRYNNQAAYMLSAIITRLTGQKLADYLMPRLFLPLGIDPVWEEDNIGINIGGGLNIKTEEIAKFGQLYLQGGEWNGRQLIPESWIAESTVKQIENGDNSPVDYSKGYGYQFWMCDPDKVYRADGMCGQECIIMPNENTVIVTTGKLNDIWKAFDLM